jgi:hypothetical protein
MRWWGRVYSGVQPPLPARLVERPDRYEALVRALCSRDRLVAVTGAGGAGKSILARQACASRRVRRAFRDGIVCLVAGPGRHPLALLANLADGLELLNVVPDFSTEEQGRDQLAAALRRKRVLIVVDDVREPGQLDILTGLAARCSILFTTRLDKLAEAAKAKEVTVGKLPADQALDVLGRWTDQDPEALPQGARDLCAQAGNLALGVALAGAMAAQGKPISKVLASVMKRRGRGGKRASGSPGQRDPARSGRDGNAGPAHGTLDNMIRASIAELPEADRERYAQLAVFARYGPFSRDAVRALWLPEMSGAEVDDLLANLTGRNLLMIAGEGWYTAHDLQYNALERRLGPAGLNAAHARLLEGYRQRYPDGWADSAADPYLGRALASHLHDARLGDELHAVLTDAAWIQTRLAHGQLPGLISDYGYGDDPLTRQILGILRVSVPVLAANPELVRSQLAAHLTSQPDQDTVTGTADREEPAPVDTEPPALAEAEPDALAGTKPVTEHGPASPAEAEPAALTVTESPAATADHEPASTESREPVAADHTGWVFAVAINPDGNRAVSGSDDGSVRVWDLAAGREQATLTGHTRPVWSVAITPDGTRAISGSSDGSVRVWDLAAGREQATLTGRDRPVFSVAITPDGTRAVSGTGNDLQVWDVNTGKARATLTGHTGEVWSVAIAPDGSRAISGSSDGTVRVWGLTGRRARATLVSDTGQVFAVAITQDRTTAVSGSENGSVQVWDVSSGTEIARWTGKQPIVGCIALAGRPIRIGVGQRKGPPFLLELRAPGSETSTSGERSLSPSGGRDDALY